MLLIIFTTRVLATVKNFVLNAIFPIWPIVNFPIYVSQIFNRVSKYKNSEINKKRKKNEYKCNVVLKENKKKKTLK